MTEKSHLRLVPACTSDAVTHQRELGRKRGQAFRDRKRNYVPRQMEIEADTS